MTLKDLYAKYKNKIKIDKDKISEEIKKNKVFNYLK